MADEPAPKPPQGPLFHQPWPGYWRTKLKLERMVRFKNLIIHRERWAGDIDMAPPLAELFPGENVEPGNLLWVQRINQDIKQTMLMVFRDLEAMGIPTVVGYDEYDPAKGKDVLKKYNLIMDYYRLPRPGDGHGAFQAVIDILEEGIGAYKGRLKQAKLVQSGYLGCLRDPHSHNRDGTRRFWSERKDAGHAHRLVCTVHAGHDGDYRWALYGPTGNQVSLERDFQLGSQQMIYAAMPGGAILPS